MKKFLVLLAIITSLTNAFAQYADPNFTIPASGYGSNGSHPVAVETFNNVNFNGHTINIYHPADVTTPVPTIFYSHAYAGNDPENIIGVLNFIASKGYAVVFVPYQTLATVTVPERYANLIAGFRKAAQNYPEIIDTSKAGFLGHSFGGAASFGISHELFTIDGWGQEGRFIYALAQWYAYNLTNDDLADYPDNTKVLVEVFNEDTTNDYRMAIDVFNHLGVAAAEKDFVAVPSSTVNGYTYQAIHNMPNVSAAFDALDYYAYYRLLDALIDYSFNGNTAGKNVALGHGSTEQVEMPGAMANLVSYANPAPQYPQGNYEFPCNNEEENPRIDYCEATADRAEAATDDFVLYPNPVKDYLSISDANGTALNIKVYNSVGQEVAAYTSLASKMVVDVSSLKAGFYLVSVNGITGKFIRQ
ncbi:T9SS type A sorting domain-containing protein [Flavobacterium sp. RHBU_24]|uniref:T9SS type A sorting domain-containing protein n=1 Tax=Flavobacterium sp. RHBU_24 TaxID=3391185 RepID=UPI003984F41D